MQFSLQCCDHFKSAYNSNYFVSANDENFAVSVQVHPADDLVKAGLLMRLVFSAHDDQYFALASRSSAQASSSSAK